MARLPALRLSIQRVYWLHFYLARQADPPGSFADHKRFSKRAFYVAAKKITPTWTFSGIKVQVSSRIPNIVVVFQVNEL